MAEKKTEKKAEKKPAAKRERRSSALRADHVKVIEFLGKDLPKRTAYSMSDIAAAKFKDGPNITAERVARNSVRKPRSLGLVEISDRGQYRLTPAGASFFKNLKTYEVAPDIQRDAKKTAKKAAAKPAKAAKAAPGKKAAKPGAKLASKAAAPAKKAAKAAPAKKAAKPTAKKAAPAKKASKPAPVKEETFSDPDFSDLDDVKDEAPEAAASSEAEESVAEL